MAFDVIKNDTTWTCWNCQLPFNCRIIVFILPKFTIHFKYNYCDDDTWTYAVLLMEYFTIVTIKKSLEIHLTFQMAFSLLMRRNSGWWTFCRISADWITEQHGYSRHRAKRRLLQLHVVLTNYFFSNALSTRLTALNSMISSNNV